MKRIKKLLAVLLSALILATLLPTGGLAAGGNADWATSAVDKLNEIYSVASFSASTEEMTVGEAENIATSAGWTTTKLTEDDSTKLTRGKACDVLAEAFSLDLSGKSAIQYLYDQNIINGTDANGTLNENGPVSHAEFAVLTYRVLNAVGGGEGSSNDSLKPGTKEYFAWMYLAARACVPFNSTQINNKMSEVSFTFNGNNVADTKDSESGENVKKGNNLWTQWTTKLSYTNGTTNFEGDNTVLENAVALVSEISGATQIFSDVKTSDWYYDGVMYLFDRGIVSGNGNGTFGPNAELPRFQLAVLLARLDEQTVDIDGAKTYATTTTGYMKAPEDADGAWWGTPGGETTDGACATRGEAIVAFIKQSKVDVSKVNTAILNRFTSDDFSSYSEDEKRCIAYAVSHGLVNGTSGGTLNLSSKTTRGEAGVLLYRTLIGVDQTKMKDYQDNVGYVLPEESSGASQQSVESTQNAFAVTDAATFADPKTTSVTLTLREDWRLTSDLDLNVPEGTTLTIQGNGQYYIYEMGGKLQNSGLGKVEFTDTILYPAENSEAATKATSDQLMMDRQPHKVMVDQGIENGSITIRNSLTQAKKGDTVTMTVNPNSGYELDSITVTATEVNGITVTVSGNNTFTMPASDVTITATFKEKTTTGGNQGTGTGTGSGTGGGTPTQTVTVDSGEEDSGEEDSGEKGLVKVSTPNAAEGDTVTLTASPNPGYRLRDFTVLNSQGDPIDLTQNGENEYEFTMPSGSVTVKAEFEMIPPPFKDTTAQAWYYESVHYTYYHDIMAGTGDGEFSPGATLSRAMVAQILYNLDGQPTVIGESTFADATGHWATDAIAWAQTNGVVGGYENNTFRPEKAVTREELAQMLYNYAEYKEYNLTASGDLTAFPDADKVQNWAEAAMAWANGNELINGDKQSDGSLLLIPSGDSTRAQAASILMNFDLNLVED